MSNYPSVNINKCLSYLVIITLILSTTIAFTAIGPETVVGVWTFDEGAGKETKDLSGLGHHGQINGAKWKKGKLGTGLEFGGGQWVEIKSTPELQCGKQLTMMAWFYATKIDDWRQLIAKSDEYLLRIDPPGEGNKMSSFVKPGGSWEPRASAGVPEKKNWTHFAATYDSKAKNEHLIVYVNGKRAGASTRPGKVIPTENPVEIGRWGGGSFFVGIIDEVAIFNSILSEEDLQSIMERGLIKILGAESVLPTNLMTITWAELKKSSL